MLEIDGITKYLGKRKLIHNLSFSAQRQECIGLFGDSGAGKTTVLNLIAGLSNLSGGRISVAGFNTQTHPYQAQAALGYQLQRGLNHHRMSVKSVLNFIAALRGFSGAEKRERINKAATRLELFPVMDAPLAELSMPWKRKVAIAQAVLHTPALLLLDEPTEGMSPDQLLNFKMLIKSLSDEMTIIIASRRYDELSTLCTRALVMADGQLVADTPLPELQRNSRHYHAVTLAAQAPLDLLALAVLPGVAGIEEDQHAPGTVTVLALPGQTIYPHINALIASRGWNITSLSLEQGRLNDVVHHLTQEVRP
ncbi:ABC transporter ATP-binding protein [Pseudomonas trivialis]|uniref:ABC transporter ATP-binding protein n=1 Tax=Pseudomonas trivialis TaxID=200450 RepID=A0A0R2ZHM5_9PSED|nr:ABC transporter ATP-binding protein [Pseudomonas trivialis]KRP60178.1 ABC transporter ATP-binding protein [Pseudomonas trivialis]SDS59227.1 ABC-2 type transport system ATP-binding protein [Pseudomonas trivialis]